MKNTQVEKQEAINLLKSEEKLNQIQVICKDMLGNLAAWVSSEDISVSFSTIDGSAIASLSEWIGRGLYEIPHRLCSGLNRQKPFASFRQIFGMQ